MSTTTHERRAELLAHIETLEDDIARNRDRVDHFVITNPIRVAQAKRGIKKDRRLLAELKEQLSKLTGS